MPTYAGLARRLLSLLYESLLLTAVICCAALIFLLLFPNNNSNLLRHIFQIYLVTVIGAYFLWFWINNRQTLAMKTWRIKIVDLNYHPITIHRACTRFIVALLSTGMAIVGYITMGKLGLLLGIIGFAWAFIDRDRQFLHDRIAKTRIILLPKQI